MIELYTPCFLCDEMVREGLRRFNYTEHEFGVVRLYRTFSNYIFTGGTRCVGCLCASSRWFEPPQTTSLQRKQRGVEFFHMSSRWFEPSLTTSSQGEQVGIYTLVWGGSTTSNLFEPSRTASSQRKQGV